MICNNCGAPLPAHAVFCAKCGNRVANVGSEQEAAPSSQGGASARQAAWALSRTLLPANTKIHLLGSYVIAPRLGPEIVAQLLRPNSPERFPPLSAPRKALLGSQRPGGASARRDASTER
jgi:hypothetical protein